MQKPDKENEDLYYWIGMIQNGKGSEIKYFSLGSLHKVAYDMEYSNPKPCPEVFKIVKTQQLSTEDQMKLIKFRFEAGQE